MTQPNTISVTRATDTPNQPLLLINDVQRRRRIKQTKHQTPQMSKSKSMPRTKKRNFKNNKRAIDINHNTQYSSNSQHSQSSQNTLSPRMSPTYDSQRTPQKDIEDNLAILFSETHNAKQKSKSQLVSQNHSLLQPAQPYRNHSKSNPNKIRKKRTFKLSEPTPVATHNKKSHPPRLKKKPSRNFMKIINEKSAPNIDTKLKQRNRSQSTENDRNCRPEPPPNTPSLYLSRSQSGMSPKSQKRNQNHRNGHKRKKSFQLGDDTQRQKQRPFSVTHSSFSTYQSKFNVHKPKIKPGSNQFMLTLQQRQLQSKVKQNEMKNSNNSAELSRKDFGKHLSQIKCLKLPLYNGRIPLCLIELKKRLHLCDGLKQRKIFHISVKNNIASHHRIAALLRDFFISLPKDHRLLDGVCADILIYVQRMTHCRQMKEVLNGLSEPNKSILLWLWDLLADSMEYSAQNKMNLESLAKSFGPCMCSNKGYRDGLILTFKFGIQWRLFERDQR